MSCVMGAAQKPPRPTLQNLEDPPIPTESVAGKILLLSAPSEQ